MSQIQRYPACPVSYVPSDAHLPMLVRHGMTGRDYMRLLRAYRSGGPKALISACHDPAVIGRTSDLWAYAMTAHYGPPGLHPSRCEVDGTPKAETIAQFWHVRSRMAEASRYLDRCFPAGLA